MNPTVQQRGFACCCPAGYRDRSADSDPFPQDSYADEFLLPNEPGTVVELNGLAVEIPGIDRPFFVGSDGGEEAYFVDASDEESPLYAFELETGNHRLLVATWPDYINRIRQVYVEIEADEETERERKRTKLWWEFWK